MQRGDEARLAIIDAAMREASRIGVAGLTLAPVADRAGWSKSGAPSGAPRLRAIFRGWLNWIHNSGLEGGCPLNAARLEFDDQPGEVRDALVANWNDWTVYLERQAAKAIEQKQISTPLSPRQIAMILCGLAAACDSGSRLLGQRDALREAESAFDQLFPLKSH